MNRFVLDASVAVKLFFDEEHSEAADRCIRKAAEIHAPDLVWPEIANVIWKRHQRGQLDPLQASQTLEQALTLPIIIHPSTSLLPDALEFAMRFARTAYDGLYLALAVQIDARLLTDDRKLRNALAATALAKHVIWIGDPQLRQ